MFDWAFPCPDFYPITFVWHTSSNDFESIRKYCTIPWFLGLSDLKKISCDAHQSGIFWWDKKWQTKKLIQRAVQPLDMEEGKFAVVI